MILVLLYVWMCQIASPSSYEVRLASHMLAGRAMMEQNAVEVWEVV